MKFNKKLQNRLNLNINDYKDYSQLFSSIEIELKLDNKNDHTNKFINISDENMKYYHIYFDNSNEEKKRTELNANDKVNKIKIIIDHQVKSLKNLFDECEYISSIYFKKFLRINITNMSSTFRKCTSLKELNISNIITNNVTDMNHMFFLCTNLSELNISNFNTNNVIDMNSMFRSCS